MLFFNPLRRAELNKYKDKTIDKAKSGVKKTTDSAENVWNRIIKFNISRKAKKTLLIIGAVVAVFFLSLYIPAWFTGNEEEIYYALAYDPEAVSVNKQFIEGKYGTQDFDEDGINNEDENDEGTDIFEPDTDGDGYLDGYEIKNEMNPNRKDSIVSDVKSIDKKNGKDISTPYSDEGVILWPDSYDYKAHGYVIKDYNGYIIREFKGWAQFPNTIHKHVYNYKDGKLKEMKYREREDAYYIDEDSYIVILDKEASYKYRYTILGSSYIIKNSVGGNILSFLLPSKGKTYMKCQKIPQLGFKDEIVTTKIKKLKFTNSLESRISKNTNSLDDLSSVMNTVKKGKCVYVSLFKDDFGESVGIVYGYDSSKNLLIADPETGKYAGKISVELMGKNTIQDGKLVKVTWFEYKGLGFDSQNGDRINFFGTESDDEFVDYL